MSLQYYIRRIKYLIFAKHKNGHGIHSPFLYEFLNHTVFSREIDELQLSLIKDLKGYKSKEINQVLILLRIIKFLKTSHVTEIYFKENHFSECLIQRFPNDKIKRFNIENQLNNIDFSHSNLIFINESPIGIKDVLTKTNLSDVNDDSIIIIIDIHKTNASNLHWKKVINLNTVRQSIDLFNFGILFMNKNLQKENFIIRS